MTTANPDNDPALLEPHGKAWLEAAKRGDVHAMQPLLVAEPRLLGYCGKGCSLGFIGHSALHWAAAKGLAPLAKWLVEECKQVGYNKQGRNLCHMLREKMSCGSRRLPRIRDHGRALRSRGCHDSCPRCAVKNVGIATCALPRKLLME